MSAGEFLKDNIWIPVLAAVLAVLLLVIVVYYLCRCRQHRRYDYSALEEQLALPEKKHVEKQLQYDTFREKALLDCQFYLRSSGKYTFNVHLPDIGSRFNKHWFLVRDGQSEKLLTMMPRSSDMTLPFNSAAKKALVELCRALQHPYIYPITHMDFTLEQDLIVTLQPFNNKGSLKDLIYNSQCRESWVNKYGYRSKGILSSQIQLYGRHILEALMFLEDRGFPPFCHLHSGNVIIQNQVAKLSGWDNTLMEQTSKLSSLLRKKVKNNTAAMDPLCFGHLVFEMAAGFEMDSAAPEQRHLDSLNNTAIIEVLTYIFEPDVQYPATSEICALDFFQTPHLQELNTFHSTSVQLSREAKGVLKSLRKGQPVKSKKAKSKRGSQDVSTMSVNRPRSGSKSSQPNTEAFSTKSRKSKLKSRTSRQDSSKQTLPIPPPPPPTKSTKKQAGESTSVQITTERSALLGDIRRGTQLKKTVTKDKSAPRV